MPDSTGGESVSDSDRQDQLKLVYDYIKFHVGLYLATPAVLAVIADGLGVKKSPYFVAGLGAAIAAYAGMFM
jgi:hypothetical protein